MTKREGYSKRMERNLAAWKTRFETEQADAGKAGDDAVRVFTISYGQQTDARVLATIAEAGRGATASGSVDTIVSVFADMGSFF